MLRCNNLECRTSLSKLAIVTTCSHVFCVECANALFKEPKCPACETTLTDTDVKRLNGKRCAKFRRIL